MKHLFYRFIGLLVRPIKRIRYAYHLRRIYPNAEAYHIRAAVKAHMTGEGA